MDKTVIKVTAFMDYLKSDFAEHLAQPILDCIPYEYEDEVWSFEIIVHKVKKLERSKVEGVNVKIQGDKNCDN